MTDLVLRFGPVALIALVFVVEHVAKKRWAAKVRAAEEDYFERLCTMRDDIRKAAAPLARAEQRSKAGLS